MKKIILSIAILIMIALTTNSCQNDDGGSSQALSKNSPLTALLLRVTHNSNAGKSDNDSDEICFAVNLPVTIVTDGQSVTVTSQDDYAIVQNALHECDDDNTSVSFVFPISLTFADGTTQTINTAEDLENVLDTCSDGDEDEDEDEDEDNIECLNIHYPISITYTDANNVSTVVILNSDDETYAFLSDLEENNTIVISYPLTITDATGETMVINNNADLQAAIEEADSECGDQDDDDDDDDNDNDDDDDDDEDNDGGGRIGRH